MKILSSFFTGLALTAAAYAQTPTITSGQVTNAASYAIPDLPSGALARGGMIVIKGSNLGPAQLQIINSFPLVTSLAGTSIKATVAGTTVDLYMIYTSAAQLAAILPSSTPAGTGTITVTYNGQTSAASPIRVVQSAFGIFTLNEAGSGPGVFQNANSGTDQPVNTLTVPARPGQLAIIWGTGLGPITANEAEKPQPGDLSTPVEVFVGGRPATITYKGRSGCCAGIDQIVFTVPAGVEGCYVPVVVKTGDIVSNFVTMSIAPQGSNACTDLTGLTGAQLESAQRTGSFRVGGISLNRSVTKITAPGLGSFETKADTGAGSFYRYDFNQLIRAQSIGSPYAASLGSCTLFTSRNATPGTPVDVVRPTELDAGPAINITGPRGAKTLTKQQGIYTATLSSGTPNIPGLPGGGTGTPDYLEPGAYTISAAGGSGDNSVGAFSVNMTIPQLLNWTNMEAVESVNRAAGQNITWTGGDPNGYVNILGASSTTNSSSIFICVERTSAGSFNIPSYVLSALPATTGQNIGFLSVSGVSQVAPFTAPRLDAAGVTATSGSQKTVTFR
jgi:uncharacterized protein (TIGR03437 family)